mgnify:CR=1 FL=1
MHPRADEFVKVARTWAGVPYRHQGRTRHGVDCIGLPLVVWWEMGLCHGDYRQYPRRATDDRLRDLVATSCTDIPTPEPGCLLLFRWQRHVQHCAIYTGDTMIHAHLPNRRVVEHSYAGPWPRVTESAWRLPA